MFGVDATDSFSTIVCYNQYTCTSIKLKATSAHNAQKSKAQVGRQIEYKSAL